MANDPAALRITSGKESENAYEKARRVLGDHRNVRLKKFPNHPARKLYTSELDIPEERIDAFVNWYACRHAPDIYQIGFDVCTSYRGIAGDMMIMDPYEIDRVDIFDTPQYRGIAQNDPHSAALLAHRSNKAHTIYSQLFVAPEPVDNRALLTEWPLQPSIADIGTRLGERFGPAIREQSFFVGYRLYPWADRKDVVPRP